MLIEQAKVLALFLRNSQPVVIKLIGHVRKAPNHIQGKIDGVELDVGQRVNQHRAPFKRMHATKAQLRGWHEFDRGSAGDAGWG